MMEDDHFFIFRSPDFLLRLPQELKVPLARCDKDVIHSLSARDSIAHLNGRVGANHGAVGKPRTFRKECRCEAYK
jgi:hypothetical protein